MRIWVVAMVSAVLGTGCMSEALARRTFHQSATEMDLRYREVLGNLAMIAHEPSSLPVYSPIYSGTTTVQDNRQISNTTTLQYVLPPSTLVGFMSDVMTPQLQRQVADTWSLNPIAVPEKLEAMRCACQWVLFGRDFACHDCAGLLLTPEEVPPDSNRHFAVADKLAQL